MGLMQDVVAGGVAGGETSERQAQETGVDIKDPSPAPPSMASGV